MVLRSNERRPKIVWREDRDRIANGVIGEMNDPDRFRDMERYYTKFLHTDDSKLDYFKLLKRQAQDGDKVSLELVQKLFAKWLAE
jgi:hypothetical protein